MKGEIYISTVGERLETVLKIVKDHLVKVIDPIPDICDETLILINVTPDEWETIRPELLRR